jgi:hypothetical protein
MSEMLSFDITPEQAGELQALMERCIEEIHAANERMDRDEADRKQMQAETEVMLRQLREMLHVEDTF